jgi:plastocyanin
VRKVFAAVLVGLLASACADAGAGSSVDMTNAQRFDPEAIEVEAGTELTFTNGSDEGHTVTAYDDSIPRGADYFSSGRSEDEGSARESLAEELIEPGGTFQLTLTESGTYRYFCIPHEDAGMKGTVVVVE